MEDVGRAAEAIHTVSRAFEQFTGSQHVFVLVTDGWTADGGLPSAIAHLKSTGARSHVFTIGKSAELPAARQFAAEIDAEFHDLGENRDVPALVARALASQLAPVDAH